MSCNLQTFSVTTCTGKTWIVRLDHLQPPNCLLQLALTSFDRNIPTPDLSQCPANSRRLSFPTLRLNTQQKGDEHPSRRCLARSLTTQNGAPPPHSASTAPSLASPAATPTRASPSATRRRRGESYSRERTATPRKSCRLHPPPRLFGPRRASALRIGHPPRHS